MANDFNSIAEQIKQLKQLLDIGAISNDEYEIKKNALLNPEKEAKYQESLDLIKASTYDSLSKAIKLLDSILEYRDSKQLLIGLDEKAEESRKNEIYDKAVKFSKTNTIESQQKAIDEFNKIIGHKDANDKLATVQAKIEQLKHDAEEKQIIAEKKAKKTKMNVIITAVFLIIAITAGFVTNNAIKLNKYNKATKLLASEQYQEAYDILSSLNDYEDSNMLKSIAMINSVQEGDIFSLGKYQNEDIEWQVLCKKDNEILVVTKNIIERMPFNDESDYTSWYECSLRNWLNSEFYNIAFDNDEKNLIKTTNVFLLSLSEVQFYYHNDAERRCEGTNYAKRQGLYEDSGSSAWWLRDLGCEGWREASVWENGSIDEDGRVVTSKMGVRPAMWISLK